MPEWPCPFSVSHQHRGNCGQGPADGACARNCRRWRSQIMPLSRINLARKGRRCQSDFHTIDVAGARGFCAQQRSLARVSLARKGRCWRASTARRINVAEAGRDGRRFCALARSHVAGMGHFGVFSCGYAILRRHQRAKLTSIVAGSGRQLQQAVARAWQRRMGVTKPCGVLAMVGHGQQEPCKTCQLRGATASCGDVRQAVDGGWGSAD